MAEAYLQPPPVSSAEQSNATSHVFPNPSRVISWPTDPQPYSNQTVLWREAPVLFETVYDDAPPPHVPIYNVAGVDIANFWGETIPPKSSMFIKTGLRVMAPAHLAFDVLPRAGFTHDYSLHVEHTIIPPGDCAEIGLLVSNSTSRIFRLRAGTYLAQLIPRMIPTLNIMFDPTPRPRSTLEVTNRLHHPGLENLIQSCRARYEDCKDKPKEVPKEGCWRPFPKNSSVPVPRLTPNDISNGPFESIDEGKRQFPEPTCLYTGPPDYTRVITNVQSFYQPLVRASPNK